MWIQILINYSKNQKMKGKDTECRCVFQSFKKGKEGTKGLRHVVTKVSEFQSIFKGKQGSEKKEFHSLREFFS